MIRINRMISCSLSRSNKNRLRSSSISCWSARVFMVSSPPVASTAITVTLSAPALTDRLTQQQLDQLVGGAGAHRVISQLVSGEVAGEPVAADHEPVARLDLDIGDVHLDVGAPPTERVRMLE